MSDYNPFDGRAVGPYATAGEHAAALALSQLGVTEIGVTNTGLEVDAYARMCRRRTGPAWCGYFVGAVAVEVAERRGLARPFVSGRAADYWIKAEQWDRIERVDIFGRDASKMIGGLMVRCRSKAPHDASRIHAGQNRKGHVARIVGIDPMGQTVTCIGGNSSGVGHSRGRGGGVRIEVYHPGDIKHWSCIVGWVRPQRDDVDSVA